MKTTSTLANLALGISLTLSLVATFCSTPSYAGNFAENHPRRAQVLGRDSRLNGRINANKGNLGGNYKALKSEDRSIHQQERADKNANGGFITKSQQKQLNSEENGLYKQIQQDKVNK